MVEVRRFTAALAPALAGVHREAFAGYMNTRLGPRYVEEFLAWFARAPNGIALAALDGEVPLAYVVGAPLGYNRAMTRELLGAALRGLARDPRLLLDEKIRRTASLRILDLLGRPMPIAPPPPLPSPTWSLVGIGVASRARGAGLGRRLTEAFEEEARRLGAQAIRLSVYPENAGARRTYERCGWTAFDGPVPPGYAMYYSKRLA